MLTSETRILTKQNRYALPEELLDKPYTVFDGTEWKDVEFIKKGEMDEALQFNLSDGSKYISNKDLKFIGNRKPSMMYYSKLKTVKATSLRYNFRFKLHKQLVHEGNQAVSPFTKGCLLSLGHFDVVNGITLPIAYYHSDITDRIVFDGIDDIEALLWTTINKRRLPEEVFHWDYDSIVEFLEGYFSIAGYSAKTVTIREQEETLLGLYQLLKFLGIHGRIKTPTSLLLTETSVRTLSKIFENKRFVSTSESDTDYGYMPAYVKLTSIVPINDLHEVYGTKQNINISLSNGMIVNAF